MVNLEKFKKDVKIKIKPYRKPDFSESERKKIIKEIEMQKPKPKRELMLD